MGERHEAVLKFQADVVAKQLEEAARRAAAVRRQQFANQPNQRRNQRPVFNAANFNPNQDLGLKLAALKTGLWFLLWLGWFANCCLLTAAALLAASSSCLATTSAWNLSTASWRSPM